MGEMGSGGWVERSIMQLENEAVSDVGMAPDTGAAVVREWRSLARDGSASGALVSVLWVALATLLAVAAERLTGRALSRRLRQRMRARLGGPGLGQLLLLLLSDAAGLVIFIEVFRHSRYRLFEVGASVALLVLAINVVIRWRIAALIVRLVLRPDEPVARLISFPDIEAHRLARFLSGTILAIVMLIGFGRLGLADVDSGAPHVIGLVIAALVCLIYVLIVFRAREFAQALIRGYPSSGGYRSA
jgi:hypothetical protein